MVGIDFPLVTEKVEIKTLADILSPELAEKLNIQKEKPHQQEEEKNSQVDPHKQPQNQGG